MKKLNLSKKYIFKYSKIQHHFSKVIIFLTFVKTVLQNTWEKGEVGKSLFLE